MLGWHLLLACSGIQWSLKTLEPGALANQPSAMATIKFPHQQAEINDPDA